MEQALAEYLSPTRTKPRLTEALRTLAMVRYATVKQLQSIEKPFRDFIFTKPSLQQLVDLGFIKINGAAGMVGTKGWELLKEADVPHIDHYQKRCRGKAKNHDLYLTEYLLRQITHEQTHFKFHTVFYPHFKGLRPDACIVCTRPTGYKIEFIECEYSDKPEDYFDDKKRRYGELGKDYNTYALWWKTWCNRLKLPFCSVEQFSFTVKCLNHDSRTSIFA